MISAQPPRDSLEEAPKEETRGQCGECHASDQDRVRLTLGAGFDSVAVGAVVVGTASDDPVELGFAGTTSGVLLFDLEHADEHLTTPHRR